MGALSSSTTPSMRRVRAREYMERVCGEMEYCWDFIPIPSLYCPDDEEEDDEDEDEDEDEDDEVGRLLRRCWRYGMPRCTAR
jgi:hypothetical protein